MKGHRTYGEFLESDEAIATNVLADKLQELEEPGIISKAHDSENLRKTLYQLTEKGADLAPVLLEMARWSARHDHNYPYDRVCWRLSLNSSIFLYMEICFLKYLSIPILGNCVLFYKHYETHV